jgi:hypothetical protein
MSRLSVRAIVLGCLAGMASAGACAQAVPIGAPRPRPQFQIGGSLTVTASPSLVNFALVQHGVAHGSAPVAITTSWQGSLCLFACTISLYGYFNNANAALSGGGTPIVNIPSSAVLGQVTTGSPTTYTPFNQTDPLGGAGAGLTLFQQNFILLNFSGGRTDSLNLEIDLTTQPQVTAGSYSGTLYIQAQSL